MVGERGARVLAEPDRIPFAESFEHPRLAREQPEREGDECENGASDQDLDGT